MIRDESNIAAVGEGRTEASVQASPGPAGLRNGIGLRGRLLMLTAAFVLFAELLIFPPSAATQRNRWLEQRLQAAEIAAVALEASPDRELSLELSQRLMNETGMLALAVGKEDMRELIFAPEEAPNIDIKTFDLRRSNWWRDIWQTFGHMFAPEGRYIRLLGQPSMMDAVQSGASQDHFVEAIMPEASLKHELWRYSWNIFLLSLLISALTGGLVYLVVYRLLIKPMLRMTNAVSEFASHPQQMAPFQPSGRSDEIGEAECALQQMQEAVSASFRQKTRLAALGEAVAKINHDLRNSLSVAQLVTDILGRSEDPRVKKAAPRLERALGRAIDLAESTLRFGRIEARPARMERLNLRDLAEEAVREGLAATPEVDWLNDVDDALEITADAEHLHRILANLSRNAGQALREHGAGDGEEGLVTLGVRFEEGAVVIMMADNGPGVPAQVRERLFQPFSESGSRDGTGLGLAIARELAVSMGGDISLAEQDGPGAVFEVRLNV